MKLLNGTLLKFFAFILTISVGTLAAWPSWLKQKQINKEETKDVNKEIIYMMKLLALAATKAAVHIGNGTLHFALQNPKLSLGVAGGIYIYTHRKTIANWCKQKYEYMIPHAKKVILGTSGISVAALLLKQFLDTYAGQQQANKIFVPAGAQNSMREQNLNTINKDHSPVNAPVESSACPIPSLELPAHAILSNNDLTMFNDVFNTVSSAQLQEAPKTASADPILETNVADTPPHLPQDDAIQPQTIANFSIPSQDATSDTAQETRKKLQNRCTIMQGRDVSASKPVLPPIAANEPMQRYYEKPILIQDTEQLLASLRRANRLVNHLQAIK